MERVAFVFELNEGAEEAYEAAHRAVPEEMLDLIRESGVTNYSIYRYGTLMLATLEAEPNWEAARSAMAASPVQQDWNRRMAPLIKWQLDENGAFMTLPEVFRLDG